jgi:hypothetical protein
VTQLIRLGLQVNLELVVIMMSLFQKKFQRHTKKILLGSLVGIGLIPLQAQAETFKEFIGSVTTIVGQSLVLLFGALAFAAFVVSIIKMLNTTDSGQRKELRARMIWSILLMLIMVGAWGIIGQVANWIGFDVNVTTESPGALNTNSSGGGVGGVFETGTGN